MKITLKESELIDIIMAHLKKRGMGIGDIELGRDDEYDGFYALDNIQAKVTIIDPYRKQILGCSKCGKVATVSHSYEIKFCPMCGHEGLLLTDDKEEAE